MKDELREYIQEHKEEWKSPEPPGHLWDRLDKSVAKKPKMVSIKKARTWMLSGAAVAAALIAGLFIFMGDKQSKNNLAADPFAEVELFYETQLNSKMERLQEFEVDQDLLGEVELLKDEYSTMKKEMETSVNSEDILEQMIENYRWRLKIMEHLLLELEEDVNETSSDHVEI